VEQLGAYLSAAGIPVWYDYRLTAGELFAAEIQANIDACSAFVVVLTPESMASEWVDREISYAAARHTRILPLLLKPCPAHILLANMHQEQVVGDRMPSNDFIERLRSLIAAAPASPSAPTMPVPLGAPVPPAPVPLMPGPLPPHPMAGPLMPAPIPQQPMPGQPMPVMQPMPYPQPQPFPIGKAPSPWANPRRLAVLIAAVLAVLVAVPLAIVLSSRNGSHPEGVPTTGGTATPTTTGPTIGPTTHDVTGFNAATAGFVSPSTRRGGTVKVASASDWDSLDPGDTYYTFSWNFARLYARSLVMSKQVPGAGLQLVPDLATSLGVPSDGGRTYTYHLRSNLHFEDGTRITSRDVKYAVLRTVAFDVLPNGPQYFSTLLNWPANYQGPYKNPNTNTDQAISTPDDLTIVFHLVAPFGGFDYLASTPQTAPVPAAKDDGATYRNHVVSSGPYKITGLRPGSGFSLVRNAAWDPASDPNRSALPDRFDVTIGLDQGTIDGDLLSGAYQLDAYGLGMLPSTRSEVLTGSGRANADNPFTTRLWYLSIDPQVAPLDNIECRKAIMYAADRVANQSAFGGPDVGQIATTMLPPTVAGHTDFDLFPAGSDNHGDLAKARAALAACGKPNGFTVGMAYRSERPREMAAASAMKQALARVGITLTLQGFSTSHYFRDNAGNPPFMRSQGIGLATNGWAPDWNDGYGMLADIVDSRLISESGGSANISVRIPEVDQMIDQAKATTDATARNALWGEIDHRVMQEAVILPIVYDKAVLTRGRGLTNLIINDAYGMYDVTQLGAA
jgi:peptide/nickel transport system substrate-binding protein